MQSSQYVMKTNVQMECTNVQYFYVFCAALRIHCSQRCKTILDELGGYQTVERGFVSMKVWKLIQSDVTSVVLNMINMLFKPE